MSGTSQRASVVPEKGDSLDQIPPFRCFLTVEGKDAAGVCSRWSYWHSAGSGTWSLGFGPRLSRIPPMPGMILGNHFAAWIQQHFGAREVP